jgi:hypothetical protein
MILGQPYLDFDPYFKVPEEVVEEVARLPVLAMRHVTYFAGNLLTRDGRLVERWYHDHPSIVRDFPLSQRVRDFKFLSGYFASLRETPGYSSKHLAEVANWLPWAKGFSATRAFVETLPFQQYGRIAIFVNEPNRSGVLHRDTTTICKPHDTDFLWFNISQKPFWVMPDTSTEERVYIAPRVAYFDSYDLHGSDATPTWSFSLRVDGVFLPEFAAAHGLPIRGTAS